MDELQASTVSGAALPPSEPQVQPVDTPKKKRSAQPSFRLRASAEAGILKALKKFRPLIRAANERAMNESDTSNIVNDLLGEMWGYDKFFDVTTEYKIRSQYCDYGVKIDGKLKFLIEIKAISVDLNDNHLFQANSYASTEGVKWVVLTNLKELRVYRLSFGSRIESEQVLSFNFLDDEASPKLVEKLKYLHKEAFKKNALEQVYQRQAAMSVQNLKKVLLSVPVLKKIQGELKKMTSVKLSETELHELIAGRFC